MNKFGGNRSIRSFKKQGKRKGSSQRPTKSADYASVGSDNSYGSASSARSDSSSTSTASSLVTARGPTINRPAFRPTVEAFSPPCHLNCSCEECTTPKSDFLDNLLTLAPSKIGHESFSTLDFDSSTGDFGFDGY